MVATKSGGIPVILEGAGSGVRIRVEEVLEFQLRSGSTTGIKLNLSQDPAVAGFPDFSVRSLNGARTNEVILFRRQAERRRCSRLPGRFQSQFRFVTLQGSLVGRGQVAAENHGMGPGRLKRLDSVAGIRK